MSSDVLMRLPIHGDSGSGKFKLITFPPATSGLVEFSPYEKKKKKTKKTKTTTTENNNPETVIYFLRKETQVQTDKLCV